MDVKEHDTVSSITLVKEQLVLRQDIDVNDHQALSIITLRHKLR